MNKIYIFHYTYRNSLILTSLSYLNLMKQKRTATLYSTTTKSLALERVKILNQQLHVYTSVKLICIYTVNFIVYRGVNILLAVYPNPCLYHWRAVNNDSSTTRV